MCVYKQEVPTFYNGSLMWRGGFFQPFSFSLSSLQTQVWISLFELTNATDLTQISWVGLDSDVQLAASNALIYIAGHTLGFTTSQCKGFINVLDLASKTK